MKAKSSPHQYLAVIRGGRAKCVVSAMAFSMWLMSAAVQGADYYWIANDGAYHSWADASNWATSADGATPAASCPNADSDGVYALSSGGMKMFVDFGGDSYTAKEWKFSGTTHSVAFRNGTLTLASGGTSDCSGSTPVDVGQNATIVFNGKLGAGYWGSNSGWSVWTIHDGGAVFVNGEFRPRWLRLDINSGGRFVYGSGAKGNNCNNNQDFPINVNGGSLEFVSGFNNYGNEPWSFRPLIKLNSGTWIIGGNLSYANNIYFRIELYGGTVSATNNVSFSLRKDSDYTAAYAKFMPTADVTLNVAAGKTMDMATETSTKVPFTYEPSTDGTNYTAITRTGAGTLLLVDVPYSLDLQSGTTTFSANTRTAMGTLKVAAGQSFTLSNVDTTLEYVSNAGTITIGAPGLSIGGIAANGSVASGTFVLNGAAFSEGDTIVSTPDATLRAKIKSDLESVGVNVAESGDTLTIGASELIFNGGSGGAITDINDATAWKSGSLPPAGATVMIASNVTAEITAEGAGIPAWAMIIVQDGATLRVSKATLLPAIQLEGAASLEIAAGSSTMANGFATVVDGAKVPSLSVVSGATLSVPGGTTFGGLSLSVTGTLAATSAGDLVLGYAANGETLPFGLAINGGTITTTSGNINFACPASGGAVTALGGAAWAITNATLTPDSTHAFNFGRNNPAAQVISVELSGTTLKYPKSGTFYCQGGVSVKFNDSSALIKADRGNDGNADSALYVEHRAQLVFNDSELYWGAGKMDGSTGNGPLYLKPDEDGWQSLVLTNSAFFYHHLTSNHKAAIVVSNTTYTAEYSTYNYYMPFRGTLVNNTGVQYNAGYAVLNGDLTIRRRNSDSRTASMVMPANVPCSGAGGIHIAKPSGFNSIAFTINNGANTATGRLTADADCTITLAAGANWAGTVDYADNVTIADLGGATASEITVGGLNLAKPLVYRVWEDSNDKINFTGAGIVPNGYETQILLQNGYDPAAGTVFELGTVPAGFDLSSIINSNTKWTYSLASIENDDAHKTLRAVVANVDYTFDGGSGETPVVDLSDVGGWRCGIVPVGQDVAIDGVAVVATGDVPSFHSITLKNGAALSIQRSTGEEEYTGTTLPVVELRAGTSLTVGAGAIVAISDALTTYVASGEENILPQVTVEEDGELSVPGGTTFGGVSLSVAGTLAATTAGDLVLGYAAPGVTLPFALAVTSGTISNAFGNINFVCPATGGTVTAPAALVLTNATLKTASAYAYNFGVDNPASQIVDIVFDDTTLLYRGDDNWATVPKIIGGGVKMTFTNGASLFRGNGETVAELTIRERAQLVFNSGTSFKFGHSRNADYSSGNGKVTIDPSEGVSSIVLNDGATMDIYREDGKNKAVLEVHGTATREKGYAGWNVAHPFINYKEVNLADAGSVLRFTWPSAYSEGWVDEYLKVRAKNQVVDSVPFVGLGSFVVDNDHLSAAKTLTLKGVHAAAGSLSVVPDKNVTLILDSGFGWAGTVVAGNVVVTNLAGDVASATVSFGALDLQADFPVKVWKTGDAVTTNDVLNVGSYINNGGKLVPTLVGEGEFAIGDEIVLGTINKTGTSPRLPPGWIAKRVAIDGDDAHERLIAKRGIGLQVIVR